MRARTLEWTTTDEVDFALHLGVHRLPHYDPDDLPAPHRIESLQHYLATSRTRVTWGEVDRRAVQRAVVEEIHRLRHLTREDIVR